MKVLVIIPAFNEALSIERTVRSVIDAGFDYVVINDGSSDETVEVCRKNGFSFLDLKENLGIGGAVQAGHKFALGQGYDADVQFDGDGQHEASCIASLIEKLEQGADLAIGSRFVDGNQTFRSSFMRRVGIRWISFWIRLFTGTTIADPTSGFRASGRRAMELFCHEYPTDYPEPESIVTALKSGLKVVEAPVVMHERGAGKSSIGALSSVYYMVKVSLAISIAGISKKGGVGR